MLKSLRPFALALAAAAAVPASSAMAQGEFTPGTKIASVGLLSAGNGGGTGIGGAFEFSMLELAPNLNLGIGGSVGYYSRFSVTSIPLYANGNVHLALPSVPELDLYAGLAVGVVRFSGDGVSGTSDLFIGVNLGGRYYFTPKVAGFAQLGVGDVPELFLGVTFKL